LGLRRMYAKRSGRLRSTTRSSRVSSRKVRLMAGAIVVRNPPHQAEPISAATSNAPAAMDFVHR
jgi:hypothetical protein